eukprot:217864-Pelagomonas_calceolata.AAC.3
MSAPWPPEHFHEYEPVSLQSAQEKCLLVPLMSTPRMPCCLFLGRSPPGRSPLMFTAVNTALSESQH